MDNRGTRAGLVLSVGHRACGALRKSETSRPVMVERGIHDVSMPVYNPNRGRLNPRELHAILHVVFAETEIMVHLHKKYYLSIA